MKKRYTFEELAYGIIVAASYGIILGWFFNSSYPDIFIAILWFVIICIHLMGIRLLYWLEQKRLEEKK